MPPKLLSGMPSHDSACFELTLGVAEDLAKLGRDVSGCELRPAHPDGSGLELEIRALFGSLVATGESDLGATPVVPGLSRDVDHRPTERDLRLDLVLAERQGRVRSASNLANGSSDAPRHDGSQGEVRIDLYVGDADIRDRKCSRLDLGAQFETGSRESAEPLVPCLGHADQGSEFRVRPAGPNAEGEKKRQCRRESPRVFPGATGPTADSRYLSVLSLGGRGRGRGRDMCGIVGICSLGTGREIDLSALSAMNASITHRGPDEDGSHHEVGRVGLAMRRLSIIDLSGGRQPISNEDETIWIVFNGEIYNFRELRRELVDRGHRFRTEADTEVIVHAYEEWGDACVSRLRGMFAFAIWDAPKRRLFAARDRVGIKQLFYTEVAGQLIFGSEVKAVLAHPSVARSLNLAAVNQYLAYLYVPEPSTLFEGIRELRAGHTLVVEEGRTEIRPYWSLRYRVDASMTEADAVAGMRRELEEAVRVRLVADVPLGAFLSGGIDSATMVALMARHTDRVKTFSIGYSSGGESFDERVYARELAERYETEHTEFEMSPDIRDLVPRLVRAFDHPCANSTAVPTWFLCEETRAHVTVALSGLGGDEVAGGYERYRGALLGERLSWLPEPLVRGLIRPLAACLPDPKSGRQWAQRLKRFTASLSLPFDTRYFELICHQNRASREALLTARAREAIASEEPRHIYERYVAEVAEADALHRALYADLKLYLPGDLLTLMDRVSMAHSLEVRVPFLDHQLLEYAATVPAHFKVRGMRLKHVLKEVGRDLLPDGFINRRKMGFSAPLAVWFRGALRSYVEEVLAPAELARADVFQPEAVRNILDRHFSRSENLDNQIWALIAFTVWHREYFEAR